MSSESPWEGLSQSTEAWSVRRWPGLSANSPLYAGKDSHGTLSILVRATEKAAAATAFSTRALDCHITELSVDGLPKEQFLLLRCRDAAFNELFRRFGDEVARVAREPKGTPVDATLRVLARWKRFWTNEAGLSEEAEVGLFGELWFMLHWLGGPTPPTLDAWRGPSGSLHDFQFPTVSVEVKATAVRGPLVHHITSLEQLAPPSSGRLLLFSLHLIDDALASNTLGALVELIRERCRASEALLEAFESKLADAHFRPSERPWRPLRVLTESAFDVRRGFPRLSSSSFAGPIPPGVSNINYDLAIAACVDFALADDSARQILAQSVGSSAV